MLQQAVWARHVGQLGAPMLQDIPAPTIYHRGDFKRCNHGRHKQLEDELIV
jgi:hypothetical protein